MIEELDKINATRGMMEVIEYIKKLEAKVKELEDANDYLASEGGDLLTANNTLTAKVERLERALKCACTDYDTASARAYNLAEEVRRLKAQFTIGIDVATDPPTIVTFATPPKPIVWVREIDGSWWYCDEYGKHLSTQTLLSCSVDEATEFFNTFEMEVREWKEPAKVDEWVCEIRKYGDSYYPSLTLGCAGVSPEDAMPDLLDEKAHPQEFFYWDEAIPVFGVRLLTKDEIWNKATENYKFRDVLYGAFRDGKFIKDSEHILPDACIRWTLSKFKPTVLADLEVD